MKGVFDTFINLISLCHFKRLFPKNSDKSLYLLLIIFLTTGHFLKKYLEDEEVTISILHSDSIAGAIKPKMVSRGPYAGEYAGGLSLLAGTLKNLERENISKNYHTLIFDTGNTFFSGSHIPLQQKENAKTIMTVFNMIGYDAINLRNEDYNFGDKEVDELSETSKASFISTNFIGKNLDKLKLVEILLINNYKVGIIGITNPNLFKQNFQNLDNSMVQIDTDLAIKKSLQYLKKMNVDITIMLSGIEDINEEIKIAKTYGGDLDIIVSSCHNENKCDHPIFVNNIPIIKVNSEVPTIGKLDLTLNLKTKQITQTNFHSYPLLLSKSSGDPKVDKMLEEDDQNFDQKLNERVIGRALINFWDREDGESLYGNFVCDTVLDEYKDRYQIDAVFINSSNIQDLPLGRITMEDILHSIPYDNRLVSLSIRGDAILDLLVESFEKRNNIGILQTAGIRTLFKEENGEIILSNATINDNPINPDKYYNIITTDYLAFGGDGYSNFLRGKITKYHRPLKKVIIDHIRSEREIVARIDGRIQELNSITSVGGPSP